jgi:uncharacterized membrane protein YcaP (DUF421 family)
MDDLAGVVEAALGLGIGGNGLTAPQMALRAVVVYVATLVIVRLGKKRFMGKATAFDIILGIMLGSIVSRAITGNAPFLPTLLAAAVLVALHSAFTAVALRSHRFGNAIKGHPRRLVRDGEVDWRQMRAAHLTEHDLWEDLRRHGVTRLEQVAEAHLERNGDVSVCKAKERPKVVEVAVAPGVQTVRIELA